MRRLVHRIRSDQRGSALVVVAVAMAILLGAAALAVDVGQLFLERQRLANAADVAALSAVVLLPVRPDEAKAVALENLRKNGIDTAKVEIAVDTSRNEVSVKDRGTVDFTFARFLGFQQGNVGAMARARVSPVSGAYGVAPLGVARDDWQVGEQVVLKLSANDGTIAPGNYQALALGKTGASMYEQNLRNGYQDWIRVDQWIDTETGNMTSPTVRAAEYRIAQDPYATYETVKKDSPRLMVIPVLKDWLVTGRGEVQVVGFAMFFLEGVEDHGNEKGQITGRFLRVVIEGEVGGGAPDFGLVSAKLVE